MRNDSMRKRMGGWVGLFTHRWPSLTKMVRRERRSIGSSTASGSPLAGRLDETPTTRRGFRKRCRPSAWAVHLRRLLPSPAVTIILFLGLLWSLAQAQDFTYTTNSGAITITSYTGSGGAVVIPDTIDGLPVTTIGALAFSGNTNLTSVTIPDTVVAIGVSSFYGCSKLAGLTMGNSVASVGDTAFYGCSNLADVAIPESVTTIGSSSFGSCVSLKTVTIPKNVTAIGLGPFVSCDNLTDIIVDSANPVFASLSGVLFNQAQTMLIECPGAEAGSFAIPDGVMVIGEYAFYRCTNLVDVTIPDTTTSIASAAFGSCTSLTAITIGNSITNIGYGAFTYCRGLPSVTIPNSVATIETAAFESCTGLRNLTLGDGITSIEDRAFFDCTNLTSVVIADSVTSIGASAFYDCFGLTQVTIGNGATSIGYAAFQYCTNLTQVTVGKSVSSLGTFAFAFCTSLTNAEFSGNAPALSGGSAFFGTDHAILYYLPGTTGWNATFDGIATALWLPQLKASASGFGVSNGFFGANILWAKGQNVVVEATTQLSRPEWIPISTNTLTDGSSSFTDPEWSNHPARFYRLRSP